MTACLHEDIPNETLLAQEASSAEYEVQCIKNKSKDVLLLFSILKM